MLALLLLLLAAAVSYSPGLPTTMLQSKVAMAHMLGGDNSAHRLRLEAMKYSMRISLLQLIKSRTSASNRFLLRATGSLGSWGQRCRVPSMTSYCGAGVSDIGYILKQLNTFNAVHCRR